MSNLEPMLARWSTRNALALLTGFALAAGVHRPWPLAVAGLWSFGTLLASARGAWTPHGVFGWANVVTSLRLVLVLGLASFADRRSGELWAACTLLIFALDGLDGWVARKSGVAGAFGAHFDMETDALFVLVLCLELWLRGRFGAWILASGLLRSAYVCSIALAPPRGGEMPRTLLGRYAFALLVSGLGLGSWLSGAFGTWSAALGTLAVVLSFARSFYWSYGRSSVS